MEKPQQLFGSSKILTNIGCQVISTFLIYRESDHAQINVIIAFSKDGQIISILPEKYEIYNKEKCECTNIRKVFQVSKNRFAILSEKQSVTLVEYAGEKFNYSEINVPNVEFIINFQNSDIILIDKHSSVKLYKLSGELVQIWDCKQELLPISCILQEDILYIFSDQLIYGKIEPNSNCTAKKFDYLPFTKVINYKSSTFLALSKDNKKVFIVNKEDDEFKVTEELVSATDLADILIIQENRLCCIADHYILIHRIGDTKSYRNTTNPKHSLKSTIYIQNHNIFVFTTKEGSLVIIKPKDNEEQTQIDFETNYLYNYHESSISCLIQISPNELITIAENGSFVLWENPQPWWEMTKNLLLLSNN